MSNVGTVSPEPDTRKAEFSSLARYPIVRELGRGTTGVVYEARDVMLGRTVALKTVPIPPRPFEKPKLGRYALFYKKKKGAWLPGSDAAKGALVLKKNKAIRSTAGTVMAKWFSDVKVTNELKNPPNTTLNVGSATDFAALIMLNDDEAKETWRKASKKLLAWPAAPDLTKKDVESSGAAATSVKRAVAAKPAVKAGGKDDDEKMGGDDAGDASETERTRIRTEQEWCHLLGHGDGGTEDPANFISGSKHCNTEQLAIELGQRTARLAYKLNGKLTAKITAYLFPNDGIRKLTKAAAWTAYELTILNEFDNDDKKAINKKTTPDQIRQIADSISNKLPAYRTANESKADAATVAEVEKEVGALLKSYPAISEAAAKQRIIPTLEMFNEAKDKKFMVREIANRLYELAIVPFPLGAFVRYKIFYSESKDANPADHVKVFDHIFDAQKESFDYNEFKILQDSVRFAIARATDNEDAYNERIATKAALVAAKGSKTAGAASSSPNKSRKDAKTSQKTDGKTAGDKSDSNMSDI